MTPSIYRATTPCPRRPDRRLLYSTLRRSLVRVTAPTLRRFETGRLSAANAALFQRLGLLVDAPETEQTSMIGYFDRLNERPGDLDLTVVLTMACNFACPYCFEGALKGDRRISASTADRLVDFTAARLDHDAVSGLRVIFYGGEPLLETDRLRSLARRFADLAEAKDKPFRFGLITNGSLLTPKTADALRPLGLDRAQVTLDGPPRLHDRSRPFRSGEGSFSTIIRNLKAVADRLIIDLSGNYGPATWPEFIHLLDFLIEKGLGPDRIANVRFTPIAQQAGDAALPGACAPGCRTYAEPWLVKAAVQLREATLQRGFRTPRPAPLHCMVEMDHAFVVDWDGRLYKCPAFIGRPRFAAGDLETGPGPADAYRPGRWQTDECLACPYLPLCFGGCRHLSYAAHGDLGRVDCARDWFDAVLPELVRQDLRYGNKKK